MADAGLVKLLQSLVSTPSVNPEDTTDSSISGEFRMAEVVAAWLENRGFRVAKEEEFPKRPNLIAELGPPDAPFTLTIEGHLDTVSVAGMSIPPFEGRVDKGKLYGRGACDMKGPMAAALWALKPKLLNRWVRSGCRLIFVGAIDEEKGCRGATNLARTKRFHTDELIVLEPTELVIVHAHKGALWYDVEVKGTPGHGSAPEKGFNAIRSIFPVIQMIEEEATEAGQSFGNKHIGFPTVNIGKIEGGSAVNIVPGNCRISVDRRTVPGESQDKILEKVREGLVRQMEQGVVKTFHVRPVLFSRAFDGGSDSQLVHRLSNAVRDHGHVVRTGGTGWYSDAGALSSLSKETVVFGPGSIEQAHTADEFIELEDLQAGADILETFLDETITRKAVVT